VFDLSPLRKTFKNDLRAILDEKQRMAPLSPRRGWMFESFQRGRAPVGGVEISYVVGGSGPPVLLLHGFPQNKSMWGRVAERLARDFTIVCADLRGYGDSGKPRCLADRSNADILLAFLTGRG
jgi:hypothetical protein